MEAYSTTLVKKLAEKNSELEQAMGGLRELNDSLEQRVRERTAELEATNGKLSRALSEVKVLNTLLPTCGYCRKIRDEKDHWQPVETYVSQRTGSQFSHTVCPDCFEVYVRPDLEKHGINGFIYPEHSEAGL